MLNDTRITRDPTAPVKHAVAALAARPGCRTVSTPAAHPVTAVLAARCRVASSTADAAMTERRVGLAERRRVLVVDEISARWRSLRRVGGNQRQTTSLLPVVACQTPRHRAAKKTSSTSTSTSTSIYWHSCGPKAENLEKNEKKFKNM